MPAVSRAQRQAMAIAEHEPGKLYDRNKGLLGMSHSQLHDFASGSESGKPEYTAHGVGSAIRRASRKALLNGLGSEQSDGLR